MRARIGERLVLLVGLAVLIGLGVSAVALSGGSTDATVPDTDADADADADADQTPNAPEIDSAGPLDGLESLELPIVVEPAGDLVDGETVIVTGSGFTPGATIAIVQCWFAAGDSSRDDCDLGNIGVGYADPDGVFEQRMEVHQLIDTLNGVRDCTQADAEAESGCRIGVGNTVDLDESGAAEISFLADEVAALAMIQAMPTSALHDGDAIDLTGSGFEPFSSVTVTQCPVGGLDDASGGCVARNPGARVDIDADGGFSVVVTATRHTRGHEGDHDCALDVYGCMLVVRANGLPPPMPSVSPDGEVEIVGEEYVVPRSPNPIPLEFDPGDAPVLPPEYTVSPSQDLHNGSVVRLEVFDMPVDGSFAVRQCADGGPRGLFCDPRGVVDVIDGNGAADVIVVDMLVNGDDSIDCTEPARRCYLTLDDELADFVRGPIRFAQ